MAAHHFFRTLTCSVPLLESSESPADPNVLLLVHPSGRIVGRRLATLVEVEEPLEPTPAQIEGLVRSLGQVIELLRSEHRRLVAAAET